MLEHPDIAEVAVIGVPDERWGEVGKACIVASRNDAVERLSDEALSAFCRESLAGYKVPRYFSLAEALPRNALGKVTKQALRQSHQSSATNGGNA